MRAMTDLDAPNLVVWPKWCYAGAPKDSESLGLTLNNNNNNNGSKKEIEKCVALSCKKNRRESPTESHREVASCGGAGGNMAVGGDGNVKTERLSPTPCPERVSATSPSTPPKSPSCHRIRTPSFAGTPPNPAFTPPAPTLHPPYDRFSPACLPGGTGAVKQMESLMARNCSELMRSLAAKYNNGATSDYFSGAGNGFLRSTMPGIGPFKGTAAPFSGVPCMSRDVDKKIDSTPASGLPQGISSTGATPPLFPGFGGFPLVDMSSTQVLLSMVRNASVSQQSPLEHYLRGAMKRPAGDAPTSPLDLSASVVPKRARTDLGGSRGSFDMKSFFPEGDRCPDASKVTTSPPVPSPATPKAPLTPSPGGNPPPTPIPVVRAPVGGPCSDRNCPSLESVLHWTVEDVCDFVRGIDLCAEYADAFREHRIDGSSLPLLTEDHLTTNIQMKLGPALKLRSVLARRLGSCGVCLHCAHCHYVLPTAPSETRPVTTGP